MPTALKNFKLAKQIKCLVGNKAALVDVEEELEVEFGESGANPNPDASSVGASAAIDASPSLSSQVAEAASKATPASAIKKRGHQTVAENGEAKEEEEEEETPQEEEHKSPLFKAMKSAPLQHSKVIDLKVVDWFQNEDTSDFLLCKVLKSKKKPQK